MNSSGIKRGLAVSAISALAIAGIPALATPASANSFAEQYAAAPNSVILYSQSSGQGSIQNDGVNQTIHLLAGGGSNVNQVRFEYTANGGSTYTTIATVARANDVFSTEWAFPTVLNGVPVTVRAVGVSAAPAVDLGSDSAPLTVVSTTPAVDITNAPGSTVPVFLQPYDGDAGPAGNNNAGPHNYDLGIIRGTTSDTAATPALTAYNLTTGAPTGATNVNGTIFEAPANNVRAFTTSVDFTGYQYGSTTTPPAQNPTNDAVVGVTNGSDDAEAVKLVQQTIGTVTAQGPAAPAAPGSAVNGTVTVLDTNGQPVRGAQVIFDRDGDGNVGAAENGEHYYTNVKGVATIPNVTAPAAGQTSTFTVYVNTTDTDAYEPAIDFQRTFTVSSYTPALTSVEASSADGNAFDVDEYAAGDLRVRSLDQNGNPIGGQSIIYTLSLAPFTGAAPAPVTGTVTTGPDGFANVPFTNLGSGTYTLSYYVDRNGTPGPQANTTDVIGTALVFKAGDSTLAFSDNGPVTAAQGSSRTFNATLTLGDGTALPGRAVQFTYAPAAGGNAVVATQANQPNGTTRNSDTQATDTTDANGVASVAISDPAAPVSGESGTLDADTVANTIGNANEDAADLTVNFSGATVDITNEAGTYKPGAPASGTVTVAPALGGAPVAGTQVVLTTDKGFFTDGTSDPAAAVGAKTGEFKSLGKTITVTVGANGQASFQLALEREAGFDDDGADTATVKATLGASTDSEGYNFTTASPLNGDVVLTELPAAQQPNAIDPTAVGDEVDYDVKAVDQFGNPVGGVVLNTAVTGGTLTPTAGAGALTSDFDAAADLTLTSDTVGTATVTVTWANAPTTVYVADGVDQGTEPDAGTTTTTTPRSDSETQRFYAPSFETNVNTLTSDPEGPVPVGTVVTETVKVVDSEGRPVSGVTVEFFQSGPGSASANPATSVTNANGIAIYRFTSNTAGDANITAIVSQGADSRTLTDTVTFTQETPDPDVATTFTITSSPEGPVEAGSTVVETVTVKDQDGNGFAGATVDFTRSDTGETVTRTTNAAGEATLTVTRQTAGTVNITAVVNFGSGTRTLTDSIVFTQDVPEGPVATTFTIESNPETAVGVGNTVVETVTVKDQNDEGFAGATVEFTRSDTGATVTRTTNAAGQASITISRNAGGTVNLTAVINYGTGTETLTDKIVFTKTKINVNTTVGNANGGKTDVIRINVTGENEANGATATLFKRVNGRNVRLTSKSVNANGQAEFRVRDLNKRQLTLYFVRVSPTADTLGATGPVKKVR